MNQYKNQYKARIVMAAAAASAGHDDDDDDDDTICMRIVLADKNLCSPVVLTCRALTCLAYHQAGVVQVRIVPQ